MKKCLLILLSLVSSSAHFVIAQNAIIDSLQSVLNSSKEDTVKAFLLTELSWELYIVGENARAIDLASKALELSQKSNYKFGIATAYSRLGDVLEERGDYYEALKNYNASLEISKQTGNKKGLASCYNNMGLAYKELGNYPKALENYLASLKIREELKDKKGMARNYNNIAIIYSEQENYDEALKNFLISLKWKTETGDKNGMASCYNNIGIVLKKKGNFTESFKNYQASIELNLKEGNKGALANVYNNLGELYMVQKKYTDAINTQSLALQLVKEIGDKRGISVSFHNLSETYFNSGKLDLARVYADSALSQSLLIGHKIKIKETSLLLASIDSAQQKFPLALEHYKLFTIYKDSMLNEVNNKQVTQMKTLYETEKKDNEISLLNKDKEIQQKEISRQKLMRNGFIAGFVFVLLFAGIFFIQRNRITKEKKRSDELLLNILPEEVAEELKEKGYADAKQFDEVTVLFTDFKGFTSIAEKLSAQDLVKEINECFSAFDTICEKHNIEKIKTIGDAYMAAGGLPVANKTHAEDVVKAALEIRDFMKNKTFEIRLGIHTGNVVAGIVGIKKFQYDIWGDTVNTASRMESSGEAGKINISETTYQLVKDKFSCGYRGEIEAKGKGKVKMYFVS